MNRHHDVSCNWVRLNYEALLQTAKVARQSSICNIERALAEITKDDAPEGTLVCAAHRLEAVAKALSVAIETEEALESAAIRPELSIVRQKEEA